MLTIEFFQGKFDVQENNSAPKGEKIEINNKKVLTVWLAFIVVDQTLIVARIG